MRDSTTTPNAAILRTFGSHRYSFHHTEQTWNKQRAARAADSVLHTHRERDLHARRYSEHTLGKDARELGGFVRVLVCRSPQVGDALVRIGHDTSLQVVSYE